LWRRIARRVRRHLCERLAPELTRVMAPDIERIAAAAAQRIVAGEIRPIAQALAADRTVWKRRLDGLEPLMLEHPDVLATTYAAPPLGSPAVSVVMPAWNRAGLIGAAIRSVQAQRFADWELIVVDDGSTDDTADVLAGFAADRRIRCLRQDHAGRCAARNHALRLASGALVAYLDSDNVWYPGFLAAAVAVLAARPDVDCLYGAMVTDVHRPGERILFDPFDRQSLLDENFIGMSTFVHRRRLVERLGGFDEELAALEDWDLILRYTAHAPAYRLPALAVRYRALDDQRVSRTARLETAAARIHAKWGRA
jgi:hypothetical protein